MSDSPRDVVITGIGLVSSLGEGIGAHLDLIGRGPQPSIDAEGYAPYFVHPLPPMDWSSQIPKRGDQRQMETWQKLGTYAAGLALEDAGIPADEAVRAKIDMVVAAGGGERDATVDAMVIERARGANDREQVINDTLSTELRPTLFLAQLSNLLAGNISIVHKVTGSSRTFMGEEAAGISALASARARIAAGQSDICLVGGAFSAERKDLILNFELAGLMLRDEWRPVFSRSAPHDGITVGSVGAFLILESAEHAAARSAPAYARLAAVSGDRGRREPAATEDRFRRMLPDIDGSGQDTMIFSGATGIAALTDVERSVLRGWLPDASLRAYGTILGHSFEAQVPAGVALAAGALARGIVPPPFDSGEERPTETPPKHAVVTGIGHVHAEGVCLLEAVDGRRL
ncbi:MAG: beta-ketoacyl-ACP synthase [Aurantimonas endophytica]|uniref:3-oxoacyl-[acyl-carrier-protein] synthase II n=1 Tax=Aurantimonas endophytica TaxID=1522175 RepID=A0A7W6HB91_9HYPH|nr:beta-ketoacyl-ACP synthase [Aurantimonas endophytica]MBB4001971.1 3-oxoacyl-[acyl-carrier-protein] synthase II [Aurantimonas endophytica]MCO6402396.1 beta-ketoacyl-ACP synthase [Aurantimonas endophytica]